MSSRRNERLFNKIAINLLNGKSRFIPLDNMIKIIRDLQVLEFDSKEAAALKEIISREIAFRMLKEHYLPKAGDKIRVYKVYQEFDKGINISAERIGNRGVNIILPIDTATVKDRNRLKTICWNDLVTQITAGIHRLWLNRIGSASAQLLKRDDSEGFFEAAYILKKKFIQQEEILQSRPTPNRIAEAVENKLNLWLSKGIITKEDSLILAELFIQDILLSGSMKSEHIVKEINALADAQSLRELLLLKIQLATEAIKSYDPKDYAAFAMLQSLLNEISQKFDQISVISKKDSLGMNIDASRPSHSA
jgi:hypothetical protein